MGESLGASAKAHTPSEHIAMWDTSRKIKAPLPQSNFTTAVKNGQPVNKPITRITAYLSLIAGSGYALARWVKWQMR